MKKLFVSIVLIIAGIFFINYAYAEELVLKIGKDEYVREMPNNKADYEKLIRELIDMYNDLNNRYNMLDEGTKEQIHDLINTLQLTAGDVSNIKIDIDDLKLFIDDQNKVIIDKIKTVSFNKNTLSLYNTFMFTIPFDEYIYTINSNFKISENFFAGIGGGFINDSTEKTFNPLVSFTFGTWIF